MAKLESHKRNIGALPSWLAAFQRKHWFVTLIFVNLSAVWLPIVYTFLGVPLGLVSVVEQSCQFSTLGLAIMIAFLVLIVIGNGSTIYDERINGNRSEIDALKNELLEQTENGFVLRELNSSANEICESKLSTLTDCLDYYLTNLKEKPPQIISDPHKQLDKLSKELSLCLAGLLKFQERRHVTDLFTSIIYRFPQEQNSMWQWATSERGLSISDLTKSPQSTFQCLLKNKGHSIFYNSKQRATEKGEYLPDNEDEYDEQGKLKGSIACFQFEIKKNDRAVIEMVVSVTSYGQRFVQGVDSDDEIAKNVQYNLDKVVLPNYIVRIKIELCLLYLKHLYEVRN